MKRVAVLSLALAAAIAPPHAAADEEAGFRKNVGDYSVYLAVMPAEVLRGPVVPYDPASSPYRPPAAGDTHHLVVSIFEARGGRSVPGAQVMARVAGLGFSGEKRSLATTSFAGATVYGGFFPMTGRGPFKVDVEFSAPRHSRPQHATFYFAHPSFEAPKQEEGKERKR